MNTIGNQYEFPHRVNSVFMSVLAVMMPVHKFFQDEENNYARYNEQTYSERICRNCKRFRNKMDKRISEECPYRQTNKQKYILAYNFFFHGKSENPYQRNQTH